MSKAADGTMRITGDRLIMFEHNIAYYYFKGQQARGRSCRVIRKDDSVDRVSVKRSVGKNDSLGSFGGLAYSA